MATFEDDPEVLRLFGTDTLPTPFTLTARPEAVLAVVRAQNPGTDVRVARMEA